MLFTSIDFFDYYHGSLDGWKIKYVDNSVVPVIYKDIKALQPEDTLQLVLEAETEEEKNFYELVGDFLLQTKQKKVVEGNVF